MYNVVSHAVDFSSLQPKCDLYSQILHDSGQVDYPHSSSGSDNICSKLSAVSCACTYILTLVSSVSACGHSSIALMTWALTRACRVYRVLAMELADAVGARLWL